MFDLGWTELLLIGIVALIVVGPKDLPGMFQAVGKFMGKAKRMAREFSQAMNDAAAQSGADDIKETLRKATNPVNAAMDDVRKSTESFTAKTMAGPATAEMDDERKAKAEKIREKAAEMANERRARETAEAAETTKSSEKTTPAKKAAPVKKATTGKSGTAKPAAKKPAASKPAAKKATAPRKPPAARKTPARKTTAKKPAEDKA